MGKGNKRRKRKHTGQAVAQAGDPKPVQPAPAPPRTGIAGVDQLIQGNKTAEALAMAKSLHKKNPSAQTETAMARCYRARALELLAENKAEAALQICQMAAGRLPAGRQLLTPVAAFAGLERRDNADLEQLLADDDATGRSDFLGILRTHLTDPALLTQFGQLRQDEPLVLQAKALTAALEQVTTRDTTIEELALLQVSLSSSLAPWKHLVRAIHFFYRNEVDLCRRCLDAIEPDAKVHRAARVLRAALQGPPFSGLDKPQSALAARLSPPGLDLLSQALETLEEELCGDDWDAKQRATRQAFKLCRQHAPHLLDELQRTWAVRAASAGIALGLFSSLLEKPFPTDRNFWKTCAAAYLHKRADFSALVCLERCLDTFPPGKLSGQEQAEYAALSERLVECALPMLLTERDAENTLNEAILGFTRPGINEILWNVQDPKGREAVADRFWNLLVRKDQLLRRWIDRCPAPAAFRLWLSWTKESAGNAGAWKDVDHIAQEWSDTFPADPEPIMELAHSAQERKAFTTALQWLDKARTLGAPEEPVENARLRITVAIACRHCQQGKPHLVEKDLQLLDDLPALNKDPLLPALRPAFQWILAHLQREATRKQKANSLLATAMGGQIGAGMLVASLARTIDSKKALDLLALHFPSAPAFEDLLAPLPDVIRLAETGGLQLDLPSLWLAELMNLRGKGSARLDEQTLRLLGRTADLLGDNEFDYALSGAALAQRFDLARNLFRRARCIKERTYKRSHACFRLALVLAGNDSDSQLLGDMSRWACKIKSNRYDHFVDYLDDPDLPGTAADIEQVAAKEAATYNFPKRWHEDFSLGPYALWRTPCQCSACTAARARAAAAPEEVDEFEDYDDDQWDDDDVDDDEYEERQIQGGRRTVREIEDDLLKLMSRFRLPDGSPASFQELERLAPIPLRRLLYELQEVAPEMLGSTNVSAPSGATRQRTRQIKRRRKKKR